MSDVEDAVAQVPLADPGVSALIGPRLYQQKLAQNSALPALTYQLISDPSENSHDGPAGLARARIQFDGWGTTKEEARAVTRAVRLALAGIDRTVAGVNLSGGQKLNEMSLFDPDVRLRRRMLDMAFWHSEEVT
jgi:Protein of unknown function (DUF3168)